MTSLTQAATASTHPCVAVVGCGAWGSNLVRNFHALGGLRAVCDTSPTVLSDVSGRFDTPARSFGDIIASPDIQAVVLATPAETHAQLALRAIDAGKHVFIEKPLALDIHDAMRICKAAAERNRIVMVGHLLHYHPAFLRLRELMDQGALGRLLYVYSNRLSLGRIRRTEDVFWSFAPHDISMILGLMRQLPHQVQAEGHCYLRSRVADSASATLRFANGVAGHVFVSWLHPCKEQRLVAVGDSGMAVFDDALPWPRKLLLYPHRIISADGMPHPARAEPLAMPLEDVEPLLAECRHFLDCIREGQQPRTGPREGIDVLRILCAAERSMSSGRPVRVTSEDSLAYFAHESAYIDDDCEIGEGTRIWHFSHILEGSRIGRNCIIGQNVAIGPNAVIGDRCKIQNNVSIYPGVTLEDGVFCGPSCVFTNVSNPRAEISRKHEFRQTVVGRGATIGANATIVCGHRIGPYCFIAAGAVVTHDVPAHALMAGNPARQIGWMSRAGVRLGKDLVCPHTGECHEPDGRGGIRRLGEIAEVV